MIAVERKRNLHGLSSIPNSDVLPCMIPNKMKKKINNTRILSGELIHTNYVPNDIQEIQLRYSWLY